MCTCLSSIDCFSDHLLGCLRGCSHGPIRICCHDALVGILHHVLLQDHPGALKEQRASFDDSLGPGYIFLMSLSAALLSPLSYISSSASCAGVAAVAGEVAKDAKHLGMVEKARGDFILLWVDPVMYGMFWSMDTFCTVNS